MMPTPVMRRIWLIHLRCNKAETDLTRRRLEYRAKQKAKLTALIILIIWGILWIL
jgi:hypothetical protein